MKTSAANVAKLEVWVLVQSSLRLCHPLEFASIAAPVSPEDVSQQRHGFDHFARALDCLMFSWA
jgi:hypothetical protein